MKPSSQETQKKQKKRSLRMSHADVLMGRLHHSRRESRVLGGLRKVIRRPGFRPLRTVRLSVTKELEQSMILSAIRQFGGFLLTIRLPAVGLLLLSAGLWSAALLLLKSLLLGESLSLEPFVFDLCLMLSSLPLLFSKDTTISRGLRGSRILRYVLFDLLGLYESTFTCEKCHEGGGFTAFLIGLLGSLLTLVINPAQLFLILGVLLLCGIVLLMPESGLVLLALGLPFLPDGALIVSLLFIWVSYLLKVARGKRSFRFGFPEFLLLAYGLFVVFGTLFPLSDTALTSEGFLRLLALSLPFLILNLQKMPQTVHRCVTALSISCTVVLLYGCFDYLAQGVSQFLSGNGFPFSSAQMRAVFSQKSEYAVYLALLLPFLFLSRNSSDENKRSGRTKTGIFFLVLLCGVCLCLTWDVPALCTAFLALSVFFLLLNRKGMFGGMLLGAFTFSVLSLTGIFQKISLFDKLTAGLSDRFRVFVGYLKTLPDCFLLGCGSGSSAVFGVYQTKAEAAYVSNSHSGSLLLQKFCENGLFGFLFFLLLFIGLLARCSYAAKLGYTESDRGDRHVLAAGSALVFSLLVCGLFINPVSSLRLELLLWFLIGMTAATAETLISKNSFSFYGGENALTLVCRPKGKKRSEQRISEEL